MPAPTPPLTIDVATLQGSGRTNQDHVLTTTRAVAVLDGATSWLPQDPGRDGGWYAHVLADALSTSLDTDRPLAVVVAEAITQIRDRYSLVPGRCPESTLTIARWDEARVEIYVLGDSPAIIFRTGGDHDVIRDDRLQPVGDPARKIYRDHLRAGHGYGPELSALVAQVQHAERVARNTPDGYWVAEADPAAAAHAVTATYPLAEVEALLLLTDGASAAVDDYAQPPEWATVRALIDTHGGATFLAQIHALEESDLNGQRWPRAKPHDDKTLAYLLIGQTVGAPEAPSGLA